MIGCDGRERNAADAVTTSPASGGLSMSPAPSAPTTTAVEERGVVLFMGTSLTAGLGLPMAQSYPLIIAERIEELGLPLDVVNAGVSGETSAGALRRVDWLLQQPFDILVLETGANDMLRGARPEDVEANIQAIVDRVRERRPDARIVLAGMRAAPNLGQRYVASFEAVYPRLAEKNPLAFIPFILEGVAAEPTLNLGDGMHPNAEGQRQVAENVWEVLEAVVMREMAEGD